MSLMCKTQHIKQIILEWFHTWGLVHLVQISGWVALVWFHTSKTTSEPKCINKSHVGSLILFTGQKSSPSDPLSFSCLLNILNTSWFICVFSSCWTIWSSSQISRKFVSWQSCFQSWSWFSQKMCNSSWVWGGSRLDHVHTMNKPHQNSLITRPRPPH